MRKIILAVGLVVLAAVQTVIAVPRVPDIPTGSKFYIENKSQSDESVRFAMLLASRLGKEEGGKNYSKPGFPIVENRADANYVLRIMVVFRPDKESTWVMLNTWLLDANGKELWSKDYSSLDPNSTSAFVNYGAAGGLLHRLTGEGSDPRTVVELSDNLKSAQVNSDGKRAGLLGWRKH
jgi:hypothetical protein